MDVGQRATVADVARLAGVSAKTVSRVYTDPSKVADKTVAKVTAAALRLRFRPNTLARTLRAGGASTTMGFVMGELTNPFYYMVAAGIERALAAEGWTLVVATTDDDPEAERRVADSLLAQRVAALLLIPASDDQSYLDGERQLGTPIVTIDRPAKNLIADSVLLANRQGAYDATKSLIEHGHRRIGYVCNPATVYTQSERVAGYRQALREAGLPVDGTYERLADQPDHPGDALVKDLLGLTEPPTAIVTGNNRMSVAALRAFRDLGSSVGLVGFDDFDMADVLGISVVSHDLTELGRRAAELALDRLAAPTPQTARIELPTRLILRGSGERPPATLDAQGR